MHMAHYGVDGLARRTMELFGASGAQALAILTGEMPGIPRESLARVRAQMVWPGERRSDRAASAAHARESRLARYRERVSVGGFARAFSRAAQAELDFIAAPMKKPTAPRRGGLQ